MKEHWFERHMPQKREPEYENKALVPISLHKDIIESIKHGKQQLASKEAFNLPELKINPRRIFKS